MSTPPHRRMSVVALALALFAVAMPAETPGARAFAAARYPAQSMGDRGSDVVALQMLLRQQRGMNVVSGLFERSTRDAVLAFQRSRGLPATGWADQQTWYDLAVPMTMGARGPAVRALQGQLNEKHAARLALDGVFGASTRQAVMAFQAHAGIRADGVVNRNTWRNLLWHYAYPDFGQSGLCDYSTGNGAADWGTGSAIGAVEQAGRRRSQAGDGPVAVGDLSHEHGGEIGGHTYHEVGLEVDLRPMRRAADQCRWGTRWDWSTYDRAATRALIDDLRAGGHVKLIYFNDPVLRSEGRTAWYAGHDDHLHVRFCEPAHPDPLYRC